MTHVELVVNGERIRAEVFSSHVTLLEFLRERGLTGAKEGCAEGECGACAVAMVASHGNGSAYRAINSCLMLLPSAAGGEFYTVEALASDGKLCEAQRSMASAGGSQCGYCTPGVVISLFAEQYRPDRNGPCDPLAIAGNLCRCTGYRPIRDAALSLGPAPAGPLRERLSRPAPVRAIMTTPVFSRPRAAEECVRALGEVPGACLIAGGTDLAVESNLRHRRWPHLISVEAVEELHEFSVAPEAIVIGAAIPLSEIGERWVDAPPMIHEWLTLFASPLIRHRATLGGNLATASPIGDSAPLLLALNARLRIVGPSGRRSIPLSAFFVGHRKTALAPGELIVAIEIPLPFPQTMCFYKVSRRRLDDISTVAAAFVLDRDALGRIEIARFAFGGVAERPVTLAVDIKGERWPDAVSVVQRSIEKTFRPVTDHRGSKEYRLAIAMSLVEKFAWEMK